MCNLFARAESFNKPKPGSQDLIVSYEGPGISKTQIPVDVLYTCYLQGDKDSNCQVDFNDVKLIGDNWLSTYTLDNFANLASNRLKCNAFDQNNCSF